MIYAAGASVARALPGPVARSLSRGAGLVYSGATPERRRLVARHLRRVYGADVSPMVLAARVQEAFGSYARYWAESLRLPGTDAATVEAGMSWEGLDRLDAAVDAGNGVILALPHLGGWDWGGLWLCQTGYPVTVVVEPLEPADVFEWFAGFRRALGMEVVALGPDAAPAVLHALAGNRTVCLLCDRDVGGSGVEVEFFGERTRLPAGPVALSLRSGAPVLPTAVYFLEHGGHLGSIGEPLQLERHGRFRQDVAAGTQQLAGRLEELIRRAPTQWHLMQPNWPSDPGYGR